MICLKYLLLCLLQTCSYKAREIAMLQVNNGTRTEDVELSATNKKVLQLSPGNIMYAPCSAEIKSSGNLNKHGWTYPE
jgi:hypothetical protein